MMQQAHQMDQYQMPMASQQQMQEQQYMWQQQQEANQRNFAAPPNSMSMPMYSAPMMDPQMHYVSTHTLSRMAFPFDNIEILVFHGIDYTKEKTVNHSISMISNIIFYSILCVRAL